MTRRILMDSKMIIGGNDTEWAGYQIFTPPPNY